MPVRWKILCSTALIAILGGSATTLDVSDDAGAERRVGPGTPDRTWMTAVQARIRRSEYEIREESGAATAFNRAQDFLTRFSSGEVAVSPRGGVRTWRLSWKTVSWGRSGGMQAVGDATFGHSGARGEYSRDGFTEWYENGAEGLEQGFTILARPEGEGPLRLEGTFDAPLRAELLGDGSAITFRNEYGIRVLRYEKLIAWDADGDDAPAHMELDGDRIALIVDDAGARYPLTIDPLLNSPGWTVTDPQDQSGFGGAVATAGDVNGDGYSDVVVGAPEYVDGGTEEGRVFLYLGSAAGLSTTHAQALEISVPETGFGAAVAAAGDVDNDGFDDVIVGAPLYGASSEGAAFVFFGRPWGFDTTSVWMRVGDAPGSRFGGSVAGVGNVNGDQFADVIIGSWRYEDGQFEEGRAYVFHGYGEGLRSTQDWDYENNIAQSFFGMSVAAAGDVNGDGFDDAIIGAPGYTNGQSREGAAYVFHGSIFGLETSPTWVEESDVASSNFGHAVSTAGDYNGDGYADVIVGQPRYTFGQTEEGRVGLWLGSIAGIAGSSAFTHEGNFEGAMLGHSVGTAGDIDGDGFAEAVAGAYGYDVLGVNDGLVFVYKGNPAATFRIAAQISELVNDSWFGWSVGTAGDTDGDGYSEVLVGSPRAETADLFVGYAGTLAGASATYEGSSASAYAGYSVASAGDVNGDGFDDVIVGVPYHDVGGALRGAAFVYHGGPNGASLTYDWMYVPSSSSTYFGAAVASAGDTNGDGFADVVVGAPLHSQGPIHEGAIYVFFGSPSGLELNPYRFIRSGVQGVQFGASVGSAGDVNGDGFSDVVVGAPDFPTKAAGDAAGKVSVFHGSPTGIGPTNNWTRTGDQEAERFGASVGSAGDVNGDGYSDLIVGAPGWTYMAEDEGGAFLYLGSAAGLELISSWHARGDQISARLGTSVGNAGDVNGDGYSDVIVGAPDRENVGSQSGEGMAFVYHGSPTYPSTTPDWEGDGDQVDSRYGASVAGAGDVNGDGYSDVIVGAPSHDLGEQDEGVTFLYLGSASGLSPGQDPSSRFDGDEVGASFGFSVASAGDVNGDGFSDVVIGAPDDSDPTYSAGRAEVHLGGKGDGLHRRARQRHHGDKGPIAPLGPAESEFSVFLSILGRSPAGRAKVQLQVEVKPYDQPFDGNGTVVGALEDSGIPGGSVELGVYVTSLEPDHLYKWRARILTPSPLFPRSQWFHMSGNAPGEADFRTTRTNVSVDSPATKPAVRLGVARPNPFRSGTRISFELPRAGNVRLTIFDAGGREVARLADGVFSAGVHELKWDVARNGEGTVAAGVYFARMSFEGGTETRKLVLRP